MGIVSAIVLLLALASCAGTAPTPTYVTGTPIPNPPVHRAKPPPGTDPELHRRLDAAKDAIERARERLDQHNP